MEIFETNCSFVPFNNRVNNVCSLILHQFLVGILLKEVKRPTNTWYESWGVINRQNRAYANLEKIRLLKFDFPN